MILRILNSSPWPSCFIRSTHSVIATAIPQSLRWGEHKPERLEERCGASGVHSPDVIFVSPYLRTEQTLHFLQEEWPDLRNAKVYREERIREKDPGLGLLYNDSRIYFLMHPGQKNSWPGRCEKIDLLEFSRFYF
jgi:hypothetical protein